MFFFQAEDGIRDIGVTGVQTCALPIWAVARRSLEALARVRDRPVERLERIAAVVHRHEGRGAEQIGRASCRERVESSVVAVSLNKNRDTHMERCAATPAHPYEPRATAH